MTDPDCMVLGLGEMGFTDVEVHEVPQALIGYHGDTRAEKAHIIIRRKHISRSSNDVGFFIRPDGKIEAIISDYDRHRFDQKWLGRLTMLTGVNAALKDARRRGRKCERMINEKTGLPKVRIFA